MLNSEGPNRDLSKTEIRVRMRAAQAIGRLDEHLRLHPHPAAIRSWFFRDEAVGLCKVEQLGSDTARLVTLIADVAGDVSNKADRTALDVHNALTLVEGWTGSSPSTARLVELWKEADRSNTRRKSAQFEGQLELACERAAGDLAKGLETPDPAGGAEIIRRLWVGQGLEGQSRRLSLILAPFIIRRAFGLKHALVGMSHYLALDGQATERASVHVEEWQTAFFAAVAHSAERTYETSVALLRIREDLVRACEEIRTTRGRTAIIDYAMSLPVLTPAAVAASADMTSRGAQIAMEQLADLGCLTPFDPGEPKSKIFACPKVLAA